MKNQKQLVVCLLFVLSLTHLLTGCGKTTSSNTVSNLLTASQISTLKLDSILFQKGDLPADYTQDVISTATVDIGKDWPTPQNQISLPFNKNGEWTGFVHVFLFAKQADIDKAMQPSLKDIKDTDKVAGLGEQSVQTPFSIPYGTGGSSLDGMDVIFTRCSAVVNIRLITDQTDEVIAYAKLLDGRLKSVACKNP